jgi:hypothetical protein
VPPFVLEVFQRDPFFVYTLAAALFLALVSLVTGWLRLDFLVLFQPRSLLHIAIAAVLAMSVSLLSQTFSAPLTSTVTVNATPVKASAMKASSSTLATALLSLRGLSRLPLYLIALAYGPTAGLLAAGLFAAFATPSGTLSWAEAVLALELTVLGWFAIAPSPFKLRWAGPLNVLFAYFLAWATGGSAFLQYSTERATDLATHWAYHQTLLLGVGLSALSLLWVSPKMYRTLFAGSRISPEQEPEHATPATLPQTIQLKAELLGRARQRQRAKLTEFPRDVQSSELKRKR